MASAKSGSAGTPVSPAKPKLPEPADLDDPGEMQAIKAEQRELGEGKYGKTEVELFRPADETEDDDQERTWIEIEMVSERDEPMPGITYEIELPDGKIARGRTDENGIGRVEGCEPGTCHITFPELDKEAWEPG